MANGARKLYLLILFLESNPECLTFPYQRVRCIL